MTIDEVIEAIGVKPFHREPAGVKKTFEGKMELKEIIQAIDIEPFYIDGDKANPRGVIYCQDCLTVLPKIPDKAIDLVLTDPPYGIGCQYGQFIDTPDNVKMLVKKSIPICITKSKRVALTCGTRQITFYPESDWILCWFNRAGAGRSPWGFTCWQPILVYGKDPYLENSLGSRPDFIEHCESSEKNGHPCPKPIFFWEKLLARTSVKNSDIILDPFLGSGTTAVAAKQLGRKFIGIEIEEKYCAIAVDRLRQEVLAL